VDENVGEVVVELPVVDVNELVVELPVVRE